MEYYRNTIMDNLLDLKKLKAKLMISVLILAVFMILYKTLPSKELNINSNFYELMFYSVTTQIGMNTNQISVPKSSRAQILTLMHIIMGFCVYIM